MSESGEPREPVDSAAYVEACMPADAKEALQSVIGLDYHHWLEDWLGRRSVRWLLRRLSADRRNGPFLMRIFETYADPYATWSERFFYRIGHALIDAARGSTSRETVRKRLCEHRAVLRGMVNTARSVGEFGLTTPQKFSAPLFCVWNFTQRCNLTCAHCYQSAEHTARADELTLDEKLNLVEQMAETWVAMLAFAGGEPTLSPDLEPVLERVQQHGFHVSLATNGTTLTPKRVGRLGELGVRYCEVSLDSINPEKHDRFRGVPGMWQRSVDGIKNVVAEGKRTDNRIRAGIAMCVTQANFSEVEEMIRFAIDLGCSCFAHFNFIPVGRGSDMVDSDITPDQREELMTLLNRYMQDGPIGILSTAPQLGRFALAHAGLGGRVATSHCGSSSGLKTRVVAKYLGGCGAGRTYACIEPNGDITPCVYMPERPYGNIRDKSFKELVRDGDQWECLNTRSAFSSHCGDCRFRNYCGGCRARADAYFNALDAPDPGCLFNQAAWKKLA